MTGTKFERPVEINCKKYSEIVITKDAGLSCVGDQSESEEWGMERVNSKFV